MKYKKKLAMILTAFTVATALPINATTNEMKVKDLPVGAIVKMGQYQVEDDAHETIRWKIAAQDHEGYPTDSTTLLTERIIDLRGFDAKEPSNRDSNRRTRGNNRYKDSNLRQWLNKAGHPWFVKSHSADEPPSDAGTNNYGTGYENRDGFLSAFNSEELGAILDTTLTVAKNTVTDGGGTETVVDKVFLLSNTEVGLANEPGGAEGAKLPLFTNDASRIAYPTQELISNTNSSDKPANTSTAWSWRLRSPSSGHSDIVRHVGPEGPLNRSSAHFGHQGVRPALNIKNDTEVIKNLDNTYTVVINNTPTVELMSPTDLGVIVANTDISIKLELEDKDIEDKLTIKITIGDYTYSQENLKSGTHVITIPYQEINEGIYTEMEVNVTDDKDIERKVIPINVTIDKTRPSIKLIIKE